MEPRLCKHGLQVEPTPELFQRGLQVQPAPDLLERGTGFEPATIALEERDSTVELPPPGLPNQISDGLQIEPAPATSGAWDRD